MDLLVSPSDDETFGVAVLEALAAGLPVLYVQCPALAGLPGTGARQVGGTVDELRQAVLQQFRAGRRPRTGATTQLDRYAIATCGRAVDTLYERLTLEGRPAAALRRGP
jgi:glycosyltransferase involved in cell wall biosynthesis